MYMYTAPVMHIVTNLYSWYQQHCFELVHDANTHSLGLWCLQICYT